MSCHSRALGEQGLHIVKEAAQKAQEVERAARRARIEELSVRPAAGTSDLLGRPSRVTEAFGFGRNGKLAVVETHDLVGGLAPVHLIRREGGG